MPECGQVSIVALMVTNFIAVSMLPERWTSLEDRCVVHKVIRACTVTTGLQEIALAPFCYLPGQ